MTDIEHTRFIQTLGNNYYVYKLCYENGTPFYIGKGIGGRVLAHEKEAENEELELKKIQENTVLSDEEKEHQIKDCVNLNSKIKAILQNKGNILKKIIKYGLTEKEAFAAESSLINEYRDLNIPLTNIVNGHASELEKKSSSDIKTKTRTIEEFMNECAISEKAIEPLVESGMKLLFVNINNLYPKYCLDDNGNPIFENIKECSRGLWRIGKERAENAQYIISLYRQRIVGIYHISEKTKKITEYRKEGLPKYPEFPKSMRTIEKLKSLALSIEDAKEKFNTEEYSLFINDLAKSSEKNNSSIEHELKKFHDRTYFIVDDNIPDILKEYINCFPTENGSTDFISKGHIQFGGILSRNC